MVITKNWGRDDGMMHAATDTLEKLYPYAGLILVGIIVLAAILTGGSS